MPTPSYIQTCIDRCERELETGYREGSGRMTGMDREMVAHQLRLHREAYQALVRPEQGDLFKRIEVKK